MIIINLLLACTPPEIPDFNQGNGTLYSAGIPYEDTGNEEEDQDIDTADQDSGSRDSNNNITIHLLEGNFLDQFFLHIYQ
jgi:hypothetical protein